MNQKVLLQICWVGLFISTFLSYNYAQDDAFADIQLSEQYNIPKATVLESIVFADSKHVYLLRKSYVANPLTGAIGAKMKSVIIESYDRESLKLDKAIDIDLKYQKKLRTFHEIINVKGKLYLISSFFNLAKRKNYLFAQLLDEKFSPSDDIILIGEIDSKSAMFAGDFKIKHSRDSSKVLVFHDLPVKRSENEQAKISVFDENFNLLWKKRINLPYESKLYERIKFEVDNDGNFYILGKHYFEKRRNSVKQKPNYEFVLESFSAQGEEKERYQLNDREKFISDLTFEVDKKRQITCTGFFSNKKSRANTGARLDLMQSILGIVFFRIDDANKTIEEKSFTPFDLDFITLNMSEKAKSKLERRATDGNDQNDPALYSYDFRDVILRSDGGAVIIAEQYFAQNYETYDNFNNSFDLNNRTTFNRRNNFHAGDSTYYYNDIMVVNIDPDGSIRWANAVPKYQTALNRYGAEYLSFGNAAYQDKIYMVFNERLGLFETDNSASRKILSNSYNGYGLALATINKLGELEINLLASNLEMETRVRPRLTKQIGKKELIFYGEHKNTFRIGRILLE